MRRKITLAAALSTALVLSGCLGQEQNSSSPPSANQNADVKEFSLTISANAIAGGKNALTAQWYADYVIPKFTETQKGKGNTATVKFQGAGTDDKEFKQKISLDFTTAGGADILEIDGIWLGEFAQGGQVKPLDDLVGKDKVESWDGWGQVPDAVEALGRFENKRYGIPVGTDGRVLFFNKKLFSQAGLPADWQPRSWDEILSAAKRLRSVPGVIPMQLNGGTVMTEATTMQGVLPLLVGTGKEVYQDGKWLGSSKNVKDVLNLYAEIYRTGLGDPLLQQETKGRDKSFELFAQNKIGILLESDYFWRSVVEPTKGVAKMADRDSAVGWAMIPAKSSRSGVSGQDFVSMSGGSIRVINPNTKYPQQAWELLQFINSAEATKARLGGTAQITQRDDVNKDVLSGDPMLSFIATKVLPITRFRPGLADYPKVSSALQQATADVISGKSPDDAASGYQQAMEKAVGADKVSSG